MQVSAAQPLPGAAAAGSTLGGQEGPPGLLQEAQPVQDRSGSGGDGGSPAGSRAVGMPSAAPWALKQQEAPQRAMSPLMHGRRQPPQELLGGSRGGSYPPKSRIA